MAGTDGYALGHTDAELNVRVGLEDSIYLGPGRLARSHAEQVGKIRTILSELSLEIASASDARGLLKLKGGDSVGF
jgi:uncharacterized protein (DUF849 family)